MSMAISLSVHLYEQGDMAITLTSDDGELFVEVNTTAPYLHDDKKLATFAQQ